MRDTTYDNAKGIGLILVILGHLLPFGNLQSSIIYSIHMPLFFTSAFDNRQLVPGGSSVSY